MRQISFVFLWFVVLVMPWEDIFAIPGLTSFAKILGICAVLSGLAGALFSGRLRLPYALGWVVLFSAWCAISARWAPEHHGPDMEMPLRRAISYLLLLSFVWLIFSTVDNPKRLRSLMRACILGTSMMVANMYLGYLHAGVPLNTDTEVRYSAEGANENGVAFFCSLSILFAFYLITRREKSGLELPKWFYWGFIVAAGLAVPLTGSRAGTVSLGIVGFVLLGRLRKINWKARLALVVAVMLVAILIPRLVGRSTISRITGGVTATDSTRLNAWRTGMKAWVDTPVLGVGAGCYGDIMVAEGFRNMPAHNTVISVLVENGLVGFALYFAYWWIIIRRAMRLPKADWLFWFGALASLLPVVLTTSAEYWKPLWFLGALVLCQAATDKAPVASRRRIPVLRPGSAGPPLPPLRLRPVTDQDGQ
jgi:O-antigen ligase